jgi:hypothetical protein
MQYDATEYVMHLHIKMKNTKNEGIEGKGSERKGTKM